MPVHEDMGLSGRDDAALEAYCSGGERSMQPNSCRREKLR